MKKSLVALVIGALLSFAVAAHAGVTYTIGVTTSYAFNGCPDTGTATFTNNGTSTFSGTIGDVALAGNGTDFSTSFGGITLAPGASFAFSPNCESSNQGGYGGATGTLQTGLELYLNGTITDGSNTDALNLSVFDSQIHSGVPQVDPFGVTTDSYVLQGGDPYGYDTGDGFELQQANGHFTFTNATGVPEPSSLALLGCGFLGLAGNVRKRLL